jgi:hypothetical protein
MLTNESVGFFKGLVEDIEKSNNFQWDFDEQKLKGKLVGMLFRREEYRKKDGSTGLFTSPFQPRSVQIVREGDFIIPEDKPLYGNGTNDFEPPMPSDDDVPF